MKDEDIAEVVAIEKLSFRAPKSEEVFRHDENKYLIARDEDKVLGFIGIEEISGEKHIINMAVHPEERRKGIGKKLIERILNDKNVFFLEVRKSNVPAQNLYEKFSFQKVGERKNYYQDNGEDAFIMKREAK